MADASVVISGASIGAAVGLLGLIVSKEQKISEFRQAWIDGLRNDIAMLIARANAIDHTYKASLGDRDKLREATADDFRDINEASARIQLRLNKDEEPSKKLCAMIFRFEVALRPAKPVAYDVFCELERALLEQSQVVLKEEWRRVKKGELFFRVVQWAAISVVSLSFCILVTLCIGWIAKGHHLP